MKPKIEFEDLDRKSVEKASVWLACHCVLQIVRGFSLDGDCDRTFISHEEL